MNETANTKNAACAESSESPKNSKATSCTPASPFPTFHIISDSIGETAQAVARAVAAQFGVTSPHIEVLPQVKSFEEVASFLEEHSHHHATSLNDDRILVFYTLVDLSIREPVRKYLAQHENIIAVDLLSPAVDAVAEMSGLSPASSPGLLRVPNLDYYKRMDAIDFAIEHDDGRNPQDLTKADIVIIGVSRSSKTPLSIYLAQQGYKVANVPLDPETSPPKELFDCDSSRLFGLMTSPDVLKEVRDKRLGGGISAAVAGDYANPEYIYKDLDSARALMRKLDCIVIHTEGRAVEETAQEILRYYERNHKPSINITDIMR